MKRRNLCNTKKLMAVILAASMMMSSGVTAFADSVEEVHVEANNATESVDPDSVTEHGVDASSSASSGQTAEATVNVSGNVDAKSSGQYDYNGYSEGINAQSESKDNESHAVTSVTAGGNVSSEEIGATGVEARASSNGEKSEATTNVSVTDGNVSADGENYASGINGSSYASNKESKSTVDVKVNGNVSAEGKYDAYGINGSSYASNKESKSTVDVKVNGNVSADSDNWSYGISTGSSSYGDDSQAGYTVNVGGNVDSNGYSATGIDSSAYGDGALDKVIVEKNLTVEGTYDATGINASGKNGGTADVNVIGNVNVDSHKQGSGISLGGQEYRLSSSSSSEDLKGNTKVNVGGNVIVSATGLSEEEKSNFYYEPEITAYGIKGINVGNADVNVVGNVEATSVDRAEGINVEYATGTVDINVGGSVIQDGQNGWSIGLADSSDGNISITVGQDVEATTTAVSIMDGGSASKGSVDLTVGGTISGGEYNIQLDHKSTLDDMTITVWKVDTSDNKAVVVKDKADWSEYDKAMDEYEKACEKYEKEWSDYWNRVTDVMPDSEYPDYPNVKEPEPEYVQDTEAEAKINYIIRVQSDVSIAAGTTKIGDYDTAHQDDTVTFAVTVPSGYEIENFYNVSPGNIISLNKGSADGTYLLTVPRGGGVDIGVSLKKLQDNTSSSNIQVTPSADNVSRTESGASDGEYWSPGYNRNGNAGGVYVGYDTAQIQGLQVHSMSIGGDVTQNITDVLTPVDTLTAFNNFEGTSLASIDMNNVMGSGIVNFNDLFIYSISDTVEVPVSADVYANQSYTVMFSDGTSMVVTCAMNGVLNIPFSKNAKGLTYIIYKTEVNPAMFMGMPEATGWTY